MQKTKHEGNCSQSSCVFYHYVPHDTSSSQLLLTVYNLLLELHVTNVCFTVMYFSKTKMCKHQYSYWLHDICQCLRWKWVSFNSWCTASVTGAEERLRTVGRPFIYIVAIEGCRFVILWRPKICSSCICWPEIHVLGI